MFVWFHVVPGLRPRVKPRASMASRVSNFAFGSLAKLMYGYRARPIVIEMKPALYKFSYGYHC